MVEKQRNKSSSEIVNIWQLIYFLVCHIFICKPVIYKVGVIQFHFRAELKITNIKMIVKQIKS